MKHSWETPAGYRRKVSELAGKNFSFGNVRYGVSNAKDKKDIR